jgi:hypothetical protein
MVLPRGAYDRTAYLHRSLKDNHIKLSSLPPQPHIGHLRLRLKVPFYTRIFFTNPLSKMRMIYRLQLISEGIFED